MDGGCAQGQSSSAILFNLALLVIYIILIFSRKYSLYRIKLEPGTKNEVEIKTTPAAQFSDDAMIAVEYENTNDIKDIMGINIDDDNGDDDEDKDNNHNKDTNNEMISQH